MESSLVVAQDWSFEVLLTPVQFVLGLWVLLGFTAMQSNSLTKVK
jgi:hypothetical protein